MAVLGETATWGIFNSGSSRPNNLTVEYINGIYRSNTSVPEFIETLQNLGIDINTWSSDLKASINFFEQPTPKPSKSIKKS